MVCLKKPKNKQKRGPGWPIIKNKLILGVSFQSRCPVPLKALVTSTSRRPPAGETQKLSISELSTLTVKLSSGTEQQQYIFSYISNSTKTIRREILTSAGNF